MDSQFFPYIIAGGLASIPAIIWLIFLLNKSKRTGIQILIFALSIFTVVPVFILQYFLDLFPQFDILSILQHQIHDQNVNFILLFISVGVVEEIVKQIILRAIDRKYLLIQTINDSIHYSLIGALGFAFAENIFYISAIYSDLGIQSLIVPYLFRSVFTTAAHLIFSGFFGYYYGIAKFSINIVEQSRWIGKKRHMASILSSILKISRLQATKEMTILRGLGVAIILHAIFNFLLQLNQILPVVAYIIAGFLLLLYMLSRKAGKLILITDESEGRSSTMARKDEEVVIELIGMWFRDKRYVDVIHICERLMERDPDNKIIQLFKAQALDKMDSRSAYAKILKNMYPKGKKEKKSLQALVAKKIVNEKEGKTAKPIELAGPFPTDSKKDEEGTFNLDI